MNRYWQSVNILSAVTLLFMILFIGQPQASSGMVPPSPESGLIRFAVIGDYGANSEAEADVADLIQSWGPDFIITVGDNNYPDGEAETIDANIGQYYHQYIYPYVGDYGEGASSNLFFPALGNHDWEALSCEGDTCFGPYFDYFTLPANERYYDFVWGPVHFFVIDSDYREPDGRTSGSIQGAWLQEGSVHRFGQLFGLSFRGTRNLVSSP